MHCSARRYSARRASWSLDQLALASPGALLKIQSRPGSGPFGSKVCIFTSSPREVPMHVHKHNNGQPIWFTLGILEALKGWDQGLKGMCVGEKRKLIIPPALGYGKEGKGKIPPESTLIFNIDLLEIRNGPRSHESFQEMDLNDDWKLSKHEVKVYLKKEFEKHGAVVNESHHDALVEDIFDKEDEDKDGFISAREFTYVHDEL
ncbi:peptidyl-prolyl cis-trans isomerase FKBP14 isoform X4 [Mesocricetus auratus]|uniref:peptidylprolyl isomerase n=1 Tax=Mesocricetus auratus TaxID=10036 RepID=A0A1U8CDP9_MESAU|nr:peptidyl-prolyl cis-trans isomerase FKBP14 isoform X4 [Mesocricetus auratus]